MPKSRQKRDNHYYLQRLRDEFPAIYADYHSFMFKNATAALIAAGLRKPKTGLDNLQSAWKKASLSEQRTFKLEIGCIGPASATTAPVTNSSACASASASIGPAGATNQIHTHGRLSTDTIAHIQAVMSRRRIKVGDVMAEMGFKKLNPSLGLAMNQGAQIRDLAVLAALETWLIKNPA